MPSMAIIPTLVEGAMAISEVVKRCCVVTLFRGRCSLYDYFI